MCVSKIQAKDSAWQFWKVLTRDRTAVKPSPSETQTQNHPYFLEVRIVGQRLKAWTCVVAEIHINCCLIPLTLADQMIKSFIFLADQMISGLIFPYLSGGVHIFRSHFQICWNIVPYFSNFFCGFSPILFFFLKPWSQNTVNTSIFPIFDGFSHTFPIFIGVFSPIFGVAMVSKVQSCAERHGVRSPVASHWPGAAEPQKREVLGRKTGETHGEEWQWKKNECFKWR